MEIIAADCFFDSLNRIDAIAGREDFRLIFIFSFYAWPTKFLA